MNKIVYRAVLIAELVLAVTFLAIFLDTALAYRSSGLPLSAEMIINLGSYTIAVIFPLVTHIMLRIKHRSNTPEGEILPFLFLSMTFECVSFLPLYYIETGTLLLDPVLINILIRFAFLSNSLMFIFISLLLIGANNNNYISYLIISLIVVLLLSVMAPNSSAIQAAGSNFGSDYDVYFNFAIALMTLATLTTLIGAAIKDKMRHSIHRSITYMLIVIGNYGIFAISNLIATAISAVILIIGFIMLMITSKESF